ncbi:MAG: aminopeptidase P family protein [Candidatus Doudnabacteria bacterium]|nr:aminopeptidase P family protein [Candidatus Doudnabacteria bacterium]
MTSRILDLQKKLRFPLLIKKSENIFYLTGQWFLNGWLLVSPPSPDLIKGRKGEAVFLGDGLEKVYGIKFDRMKNIPRYVRGKRLQIEPIFTFAEGKYLEERIPRVKLVVAQSPVDSARAVKDREELAMMRKSYGITARVWQQVKRALLRGSWTEAGLAQFITRSGIQLGADGVSFDPIVAAGPNAAVPHHRPTKKKLRTGESVIVDFGFKYRGYCSDFTRTVFLQAVPKRLANAYKQVESAYEKALSAARPGESCARLYRVARAVLGARKLDRYFIHNLGHGAGLEIHELPNLSSQSREVLQEGMVFSIEPGVYFPKVGGVRIEDLIYFSQGQVRKFIHVPTQLAENIIK